MNTKASDRHALIVGGGIGGLTAANTLRAAGIPVTLLEQAAQLGEVGAGLQIGPNASRVLYRLGLEGELNRIGMVVQESVRRRWRTGEILTKTTLGAAATHRYGTPYFHLHRADLHAMLLEAALDPARPGPAVEFKTSSRVEAVENTDGSEPAAVTADGQRYAARVVIGADGIHSAVRRAIGGPAGINISGDMAYRTLLPADKLRDDPATAWIFDWPAANFWLGHDRHLVAYPVRGMSFVNIVAVVPASAQVQRDWKATAPAGEMREHYRGWDERLTRLLEAADPQVMAWALNHQDPFENWSRGHVTLLGDACHAMLPYFSQGASQAIEDGAVLAEELAKADLGVPEALQRYAARRARHAGIVQKGALGNRGLFHLPDGPEQEARDARFREHHQESDVSFDFIYRGTPLDDDQAAADRLAPAAGAR